MSVVGALRNKKIYNQICIKIWKCLIKSNEAFKL